MGHFYGRQMNWILRRHLVKYEYSVVALSRKHNLSIEKSRKIMTTFLENDHHTQEAFFHLLRGTLNSDELSDRAGRFYQQYQDFFNDKS